MKKVGALIKNALTVELCVCILRENRFAPSAIFVFDVAALAYLSRNYPVEGAAFVGHHCDPVLVEPIFPGA